MSERLEFAGQIAGIGSASGVRVVVGRWERSPWGPFSDVMLAEPDGTRVLLAPTDQVAEFVSQTYVFDRVETGPVEATVTAAGWRIKAPGLELNLQLGRRTPLGHVLRLVPARVAAAPAFALLTDPVARVVLRGVRTRGSAGNRREEFYGATDLWSVRSIAGSWQGSALGALERVWPEPRFGFGSTPARPSVTTLVTTVVQR